MTSQMLVTDNPVNLSQACESARFDSTGNSVDARQSRLLEAMKSHYPFDQQVKFLDLQAETESLLRQMQALKQQRAASTETAQVANV